MLVAYQIQVLDERKTQRLQRRRRGGVVRRYTEAAHFVLPPHVVFSANNGAVTRRLLRQYLPIAGDFDMRVLVPDLTFSHTAPPAGGLGGGADQDVENSFVWLDLQSDDQPVVGVDNVITLRLRPAATSTALTRNAECRATEECNMSESGLLGAQQSSMQDEISEKVGEALEQIKKDSKKTLAKIGNGLKAFGNFFKTSMKSGVE
jgi:hypothetical protein